MALNSVASDLNSLFLKGLEKEQFFRWYGLNFSIFEAAWRHKKHHRITQEYFDTMIPVICSTYSSKTELEFWFVWKEAITQEYWYDVTESCGFQKPDLSDPFYPFKSNRSK